MFADSLKAIDRDRRRPVGVTAMTLAAAQFGMSTSAAAQETPRPKAFAEAIIEVGKA